VSPYLQTLGKAQLQGYPALRPRSLELLTLLLAHPEGIEGEKQGLEVQNRPYRLLSPIEADFLQLQEALERNQLYQALTLYQGPLLPRSQAPGIELLRHRIEEQLKEAVLQQPDLELLYRLAQQIC